MDSDHDLPFLILLQGEYLLFPTKVNPSPVGIVSMYASVLRIRDVYPGSRILIFTNPGSRISDPGSRIQKQQQKRGMKKISCHNFLCSHKFHKIAHYFSFDVLKKKIWANFQRIVEIFTQKIVNKLSKLWIWDSRSGIRKKPIPDPGSRDQKGNGSRIRIRNTGTHRYE
jgi:hypothetical protein